jgi:hypothetical protein
MKTSKIIFIILFTLNSLFSFSQISFTEISGRVTDEKSHPIEFTNVFVNNTSIATTTDVNGNYKLNIPNNIPKIEMIVSFVGFQKVKQVILLEAIPTKILNFTLKTILIQEVKVTAKRDGDYRRKWEIFKNIILGQSDFTKDCEIQNADNLIFEEDSERNLLITATQPFYVINRALGYKITIDMSLFKYNEKKWVGILDEFFEKLPSENQEQEALWKKNRTDAYESSFRNFLATLQKGDIAKSNFLIFQRDIIWSENKFTSSINPTNDFEIQGYTTPSREQMGSIKMSSLKIPDFYFYDNQREVHTLFCKKEIIVFLKNKPDQNARAFDIPYEFSSVVLPLKSMTFDKSGWMIKPNGVVLGGYWKNEGASISLPIDYTVE